MAESNEIKIVRLETKMEDLSTQFVKMDVKVDNILQKLDAMAIVESELASLRLELIDQKKEVEDKFKAYESKRWVQNTLSAALGAILSVLIAYFITTIGK